MLLYSILDQNKLIYYKVMGTLISDYIHQQIPEKNFLQNKYLLTLILLLFNFFIIVLCYFIAFVTRA